MTLGMPTLNTNLDHIDPKHIKPPPRQPVEEWDKWLIDNNTKKGK